MFIIGYPSDIVARAVLKLLDIELYPTLVE